MDHRDIYYMYITCYITLQRRFEFIVIKLFSVIYSYIYCDFQQ